MIFKGLTLHWPVYKAVNELLEGGAPFVTVALVKEHINGRWEYNTIKTILDRLADQRYLVYGPTLPIRKQRTYLNGDVPYVDVRRDVMATIMNKLYDYDEGMLNEDLAAIDADINYGYTLDMAANHRREKKEAARMATRRTNKAHAEAVLKAWEEEQGAEANRLQRTVQDVARTRREIKADPDINVLIG